MEIHKLGTLADLGAHLKTSQNINLWLAYLLTKEKREAEKIKAMFGGNT